MNNFRLFALILSSVFMLMGHYSISQEEIQYDSTLAKKLGADEYGMKSYSMVILKTGTQKASNDIERDSLFSGHLKNITQLSEEGKLIVAGPLGENELGYRGIFILTITDTNEAKSVLSTDPAIKAGLLDYDIFPWYGSAALPKYLETHERIQKTKF